MVAIRPFARSDREQLTRLVNAHVAAAMPAWSISVAGLLAQLEREPAELVVEPWVAKRATMVAVERDCLVAAAHLRRYGDEGRVGASYRDTGEIAWLVCWPTHLEAGRVLLSAVIDQLEAWRVRLLHADGALPTPATYGVSDAWPHIQALYLNAGFDPAGGQTEVQLAGSLERVDHPGPAPVEGLILRRAVGPLATSFDALLDEGVVGAFEVDDDLSRGGTMMCMRGWADIANHWVREDLRGRGIGTWLFRHGVDWLRLGGTDRLLTYAIENDNIDATIRYYGRFGLLPINRTRRGWTRSRRTYEQG